MKNIFENDFEIIDLKKRKNSISNIMRPYLDSQQDGETRNL